MSHDLRRKKQENSPTTTKVEDTAQQQIRKVLAYQLDLEILHKWREVQVLREELERGKQILKVIEKLIMNEYVYGGDGGGTLSARSTPGSGDLSGHSPGRRGARSVSYTTSKDRPQSEPHAQYEVRPDGTIVRMKCPKCGADLFRSMLGFLNHCRIHCRLTFSSQDDRLQRCGIIIDPSEVPLDYFNKHPTQLKQEMDLAMIRADVIGPMNDLVKKPMIRVESGDTDFVAGGVGLPGSAGGDINPAPFVGSRYYVKRRIIIGNATKSLVSKLGIVKPDPGELDGIPTDVVDGKIPTHKWRVYVKSPKGISDPSHDVNFFIKAVRFFLHPSYRPNDIVDVTEAPFELTRSGWGEFPIRIQIHFCDPRNKPVEIVHFVRVMTATTGKYSILAEQAYDLNLDKRTDFHNPSAQGIPIVLPETARQQNQVSDEDVLLIAVNDFPLAGRRGKRALTSTKYRPASSMEEFLRMELRQQKILEFQRANALCNHLMGAFPTFSMSSEDVVTWCREKGYTPASVVAFVSALDGVDTAPGKLFYCRFCGVAHLPQDKFEILQKNCSIRPRKIHVSSRTSSLELSSRFELLPENSEAVKRLKQDFLGPYIPYYNSENQSSKEMTFLTDEDKILAWTRQEIQNLNPGQSPPQDLAVRTMVAAWQVFMKKLIDSSIKEIPDSKERVIGRPVLLTPLHTYRAILNQPDFDFLSNAYMLGGGALPKDPPSQ